MTTMRMGIVGGGLIGLAVGRQLMQVGDVEVTILEKEAGVARHQSGHNSGVVHAGVYYPPGSLKAQLCRRGAGMLREYCQENGLAYVELGKVVVARDHDEIHRLRVIEDRARANGVPGLRWLDEAALRQLEPHVRGVAGLHSPSTAIVDYAAIAQTMAADIRDGGGQVETSCEVTSLVAAGDAVMVRAHTEEWTFDRLVVCAGLQSDRVARLAGDTRSPAIVPFRGEYYRLDPRRTHLVNGLVYPVPDPAYPFLGVHFTPRVSGEVDIGPNAVLAVAREGYRRRDVERRQLVELVTYPGIRRLMRRHWRAGVAELRGSLSKRAYLSLVREYIPALQDTDVVRSVTGVRAQAVAVDGTLLDDFCLGQVGPVVTVRNAPSPAATSSLAIAELIVDRLLARASG